MPDSGQIPEVVKTGGVLSTILGGVAFLLWAIGRAFPSKNQQHEEHGPPLPPTSIQLEFLNSLKGNPQIREMLAEYRDDRMLDMMKELKRCMDKHERLLRNIRDIAADTARANDISVHYDND